MSVIVTLPGFPVTDVPVDMGGPTAQVAGSSISEGTGYAAFPYPGEFVPSIPGLAVGLLAQGAAGLPPIKLPTLPPYPFSVKSDAQTPTATMGSGPYQLLVRSNGLSSDATATGGVQLTAAGNASLVKSTAVLDAAEDSVEVTATSQIEALTIGLLTLGQVRSTATMRLEPGGTVTRSTTINVDGVRIAGLAVSVNADGLDVAGIKVPLPVGSLLSGLLKGAGITFEFAPAEEFDDRVVAPAIVVTMPVNGAIAGAGVGTMRMTLGGATASLKGAADVAPATGSQPPARNATSAPSVDTFNSTGSVSSGATPGTRTPSQPTATAAPVPTVAPVPTAAPALLAQWDIRTLYLLLGSCAFATWGLGQLIRLMGVRDRWTSITG